MRDANKRLRGRQTKLNMEYSVCIALLCAFLASVGFVAFIFINSADANNETLDERAGVNSVSNSTEISQDNQANAASAEATVASDKERANAAESSVKQAAKAKGVSATVKASASANTPTAVKMGSVEDDQTVHAKAVKSMGKKHYVEYEWSFSDGAFKAIYEATGLYDKAGSRQFISLPFSKEVRAGEKFTVSSDYAKGDTYFLKVGTIITGKLVFEGWSLSGTQTMPDEDLVITGKWSFIEVDSDKDKNKGDGEGESDAGSGDQKDDSDGKTDESGDGGDSGSGEEKPAQKHKVTYSWEDCPSVSDVGCFVNEAGEPVELKLPDEQNVEEGKSFNVDTIWMAGTKVYFRDFDTLTLQRQYVFSGWSVSGAQEMGASDVEIKGTWTSSIVTHKVEYAWINGPSSDLTLLDEDGKELNVVLPDSFEVVPGVEVFLDESYVVDEKYAQVDTNGNVVGYWVFHDWNSEDCFIYRNSDVNKLAFIVENSDVKIVGEWTFTSACM